MSELRELCDNPGEKTRKKLLKGLIAPVMKDGFQQWRMEDVAKLMDVSRATMYKHFSSKQEVVEGIVKVFVDYIEKLEDRLPGEDDASYGMWFQWLYEQSVSLAGKISDVFMKELQAVYPELYDELREALNVREQRTLACYRDGIERGIFNPVNEQLLLLQDELLLREIMSVKYLLTHQVSIRDVLKDYYQLKRTQLFRPERAALADDAKMEPVFDYLAEKFNKSL